MITLVACICLIVSSGCADTAGRDQKGSDPDYAAVFRDTLDLERRVEHVIDLDTGLPRGGAYVLRLTGAHHARSAGISEHVYALSDEFTLRDENGKVLERLPIDEIEPSADAWTHLGRFRIGATSAKRVRSAILVLETEAIGTAPMPWRVVLYLRPDPFSFFL